MLRRLRRLGLRKPPVGRALGARTPFVVVCSATFFYARKNATHFSLSGVKKRHIPPERYAKYLPDWLLNKNNKIRLDNKSKIMY
jgi:hypothetical protein